MVYEAPEEVPTYFPDSNPHNMEAILSMEIVKDIEPMELIASGALTSEYIRVKPNWKSPYRNVLSGEEQYQRKLIKYSYKEDLYERPSGKLNKYANDTIITNKRWGNKKGYSPFSLGELNITSIKGDFNASSFRISDEIYGFYDSTPYNSKYSPWWTFLDEKSKGFTFAGATLDFNGDKQIGRAHV